ncbi:hypothetical protein OAT71_01840 [Flavobacteriales bacterium]|nr:hypothetical protein [Flavobacteriales bacterium]
MNKTICFISNYYKTYLFVELAKNLELQGVNVCWITNDKKYHDLLSKDYPEKSILHLNWEHADKPSEKVGEYKLNELIFSDRVLVKQKEKGKRYLTNIQQPIYDFIKENNISSIFGEITWGHELLIQRICSDKKELDCKFYNPHTIRKPSERFGFFSDECQSVLAKGRNEADLEMNMDRIDAVPTYLTKNNQILKQKNSLKGYSKRVVNFAFNKNHDDEHDPTRNQKAVIMKYQAREILNRKAYKQIKTVRFSVFKDKDYVFYGFHKQPESSIDVIGRYYEDQFEIVKNLWRLLDTDSYLVVKEHTNAIGDRSAEFYKKCQALPNVLIANATESAGEIIKKSKGVFTVSGTIALEAMLFEVPSFTLANAFFNGYGKCIRITQEDLKNKTFGDLVNQSNNNAKSIEDFKKMVQQYSYDGIIGDAIHTDGVMDPSNITNLTKAFLAII